MIKIIIAEGTEDEEILYADEIRDNGDGTLTVKFKVDVESFRNIVGSTGK